MSGAIMPEPLAMPAMRIGPPSPAISALAPFGKVSVVMIARAAISMASSLRASVSAPIFTVMRSSGSGSPITPVEEENTRAAGIPSAAATAPVTRSTAACPPAPVKALALPEFTTMAAP